MCKILNKYTYIVLHFQSTKIVNKNWTLKLLKIEIVALLSGILKSNVKREVGIHTLQFDFTRQPFASVPPFYRNTFQPPKVDPLSPNRVNERNARVYRPISFNPSRLVLSCCSACFFFVQRFSIYQVLLLRTCLWRVRRDAPHERAECSRGPALPRTYVHESGTMEGSVTRPATLIMRVCIRWRNTSDTRSGSVYKTPRTYSADTTQFSKHN